MSPGPTQLIIVLVIVLLLFGAKKIPELAKGLGTGMREFRQGASGELEDDNKDDKDKNQESKSDKDTSSESHDDVRSEDDHSEEKANEKANKTEQRS